MGPYYWCYLLLLGSALLPWLNSEVIMASMSVIPASSWGQLALVCIATAGQMTGKCVLYWAGRGALKFPAAERKLESWNRKMETWTQRRRGGNAGSMTILLMSATFGVPPFYPVSVMAGSLRVPFRRFLAIGAVGRILHYGAVVWGARLLSPLFH